MKHQLIIFMIAAILVLGLMGCDSVNTQTANTATKTTMSDSDLENAIKTKIDTDAQLKAAGLDVDAEAEKKTVTVSGTVETQELRTKAIDLAKSAQAGLIITDKIDVKPREITRADYTDEMAREARTKAKGYGENIGESIDDAWIHTKIVAKLIGNATTPQRKINVDVVNNAVTLRGAVDNNDEKAEAERVAKATEGVKSVKNMLVVKKV
jgi:hyperosmotically inducible periplasmic protein